MILKGTLSGKHTHIIGAMIGMEVGGRGENHGSVLVCYGLIC